MTIRSVTATTATAVLFSLCVVAGGASAQTSTDSMGKMNSMSSGSMKTDNMKANSMKMGSTKADCMHKANMEKDSMKKSDMMKHCDMMK